MSKRTHHRLECGFQLYIVDEESVVCPECRKEYRVEYEETGTRVYLQGDDVCVQQKRMRRVKSKAQRLAEARQ